MYFVGFRGMDDIDMNAPRAPPTRCRNTEETYRSATDQHVPGNYPLLEKFHIWPGISPYGKSIFLPELGEGGRGGGNGPSR